jgi:cell division protein ZapE
MLAPETLVRGLGPAPEADELLRGFVPPPRFAGKSFGDYRPDPAHPSQAAARDRVQGLASALRVDPRGGLWMRIREALGPARRGRGLYLDGGFGVGKTHLLAALWNAAPGPKAYLSFDELVYAIGLLGLQRARVAFGALRLVAVDEWELDDPGNLKLALAFLRGALEDGVVVAVTSNTLPAELGEGRFSQKDFTLEIEELASAFEVVGIRGDDYRHRHFEARPGLEYFLDPEQLRTHAAAMGPRALVSDFGGMLRALRSVHPIRYADLADSVDGVFLQELAPIGNLPDALRWVHFVDKLYDSAVPFGASSATPLGTLFAGSFLEGPFAKKLSRCLSRMEELLSEERGDDLRASVA